MSFEPCPKCSGYNTAIIQEARAASKAQEKGKPVQKYLDNIASLKDSRANCTREGHPSSMVASREATKKRHAYDNQKKLQSF